MNKTNLIFLRHGKSESSEKNLVQGQGLLTPLVEEGRQQADLAAKKLRKYSFDGIFTSTARRAIETADIIRQFHANTPYAQIPELNERSKGLAEGIPKEEFLIRYPHIIEQWNQGVDARPEGGENFEDVEKRVLPIIESHLRKNTQGSSLLYVIHGNVIRVILGHILHIPFGLRARIVQDYCALNCVTYDYKQNRWEVEYVNRTA